MMTNLESTGSLLWDAAFLIPAVLRSLSDLFLKLHIPFHTIFRLRRGAGFSRTDHFRRDVGRAFVASADEAVGADLAIVPANDPAAFENLVAHVVGAVAPCRRACFGRANTGKAEFVIADFDRVAVDIRRGAEIKRPEAQKESDQKNKPDAPHENAFHRAPPVAAYQHTPGAILMRA